MRSSCLFYPDKDAQIWVEKCGETDEIRFMIGTSLTFRVTRAQMLDLGMKIQSLVTLIDRENRVVTPHGGDQD